MGLFRYILSGAGRRALKRLDKMADAVLSLESKYKDLTDAELRAQTDVLKGRLKNGETVDEEIHPEEGFFSDEMELGDLAPRRY